MFVDGDFWHGRDFGARKAWLAAGNNGVYWVPKIEKNMERDARQMEELERLGWTVLRFWSRGVMKDAAGCAEVAEVVKWKLEELKVGVDNMPYVERCGRRYPVYHCDNVVVSPRSNTRNYSIEGKIHGQSFSRCIEAESVSSALRVFRKMFSDISFRRISKQSIKRFSNCDIIHVLSRNSHGHSMSMLYLVETVGDNENGEKRESDGCEEGQE